MEIILKAILTEEQISAKSKEPNIDAFEVQLFDFNENYELGELVPNIRTVHLPMKEVECNLLTILNNWHNLICHNRFLQYINFAKKYNAKIVIHNDMTYQQFIAHPNVNDFITYLKHEDIFLLLENITILHEIEIYGKPNISTLEIPRIVSYINRKVQKKTIAPLLDICHAVSDSNALLHPYASLQQLLLMFATKDYYLHFNYALGDGKNDENRRHGVGFESNLYLFEKIMTLLKDLEDKGNHVHLILEVYEDDYVQFNEAKKLKKLILDFLEKNK